MTCIVGFANDKIMLMGGDSAGVDKLDVVVRNDPKVFPLRQEGGPDVLVGFTSSFRMGQILMGLKVPRDRARGDPFCFMMARFVPAVRALFAREGFLMKENDREWGGKFLVGYRGKLFLIGIDFQVCDPADQYHAIGCGDNFALGAMDACFAKQGADPAESLMTAMKIAEKRSGGVRGPFRMERVDLK